MKPAAFDWADPLRLEDELSEDERMVRTDVGDQCVGDPRLGVGEAVAAGNLRLLRGLRPVGFCAGNRALATGCSPNRHGE